MLTDLKYEAQQNEEEMRVELEKQGREQKARTDAIDGVIAAAHLVLARWEKGNLAEAVRELDEALRTYEER